MMAPGKGKGGKGFPAFKGFGGKGGKAIKVHGEFNQMVYVGNLSYKAQWQDLKDHMKQAGNVEFVKILTEDGSEYGRSKGIACIRYTTQDEADQAVATLKGSDFMGRQIIVDKWTKSAPPSQDQAADAADATL